MLSEFGAIEHIDGVLYLYLVIIVFAALVLIGSTFVIVNACNISALLIFGS